MLSPSGKPLRLALIGMSGSGKSHWAKNLAAVGCPTISCDDQIEFRLAPVLRAGGYTGIKGVAAWMGWPDSPTYAHRESEYLTAEIAVLDETLSNLENDPDRNLVLDTSGSVIVTGNHILHRLRRQMTVVYLAASGDQVQLLIRRYLEEPKPVLWQGAFRPKPGETPRETVIRCYPLLIAARRRGYEALAHLSLPTSDLHVLSPSGSTNDAAAGEAFLETVGALLESRR
jgi:shikimate kinase